ELRSADAQVRSIVDHNIRFVTQNIFAAESLSEELLREDVRRVEFSPKFFLIIASPIKLRTRVQAAEVGMTADMIPVRVSNEHGCHWRQSWRIGLQRFVRALCEIRSRARINSDQFVTVLGNHEVVFREFETGERVDTMSNDFANAPRRECVTGNFVFGKRRYQ